MYQECKPFTPLLGLYVDCFWMSETLSPSPVLILPDGAMDLLFHYSQGRVETSLCGAMSRARPVTLSSGDIIFGVRFYPGMAAIGLRLNGAAFQDVVAEGEFLKQWHKIHDLLPLGHHVFSQLVAEMEKQLVQELTFNEAQWHQVMSFRNVTAGNVAGLAASLGVSRKKFYRDFVRFYGLSPRLYANVKRLLLFRHGALSHEIGDLSDLALTAGFYDQADMTRHIKRLTGQTPLQLLSQLYNTDGA